MFLKMPHFASGVIFLKGIKAKDLEKKRLEKRDSEIGRRLQKNLETMSELKEVLITMLEHYILLSKIKDKV